MTGDAQSKPSFSPGRKWGMGVDMAVRTVLVLAVLVMVNYLSGRHFERIFLSLQTQIKLSPRTVSVLKAATNNVEATLYYDREDPFFTTVAALLNEYRSVNPRIHVEAVDPVRDPGRAAAVIAKYNKDYPAVATNKNLVIFNYERRVKIAYGDMLVQYTRELVSNSTNLELHVKPVAFLGEQWFTADLLAVFSPKPLHAYFLKGHGEHAPDDGDETMGYLKFKFVLQQNYVLVDTLSLLGTNTVPADCDLLVIAGPKSEIPAGEVEKVKQYLLQGGRLLALLNPPARVGQTGLEKILTDWGVSVGPSEVRDPQRSSTGSDVVVSAFSEHPIVKPLFGSGLDLILPCPVGRLDGRNPPADAPRVEVLAASSTNATMAGDPMGRQRQFPLAVAVEKGAVRGVSSSASTRIVAVGDSIFLGNRAIEFLANRDFAASAINWLLDRTQLVEGVGPRPVTEFRLVMTRAQLQTAQWILLAGLPGAVLAFGGLIWLRRRK